MYAVLMSKSNFVAFVPGQTATRDVGCDTAQCQDVRIITQMVHL